MLEKRVLLMLLLGLLGSPAQAHRLQVFAYFEARTIAGHAYFAGGARAAGAPYAITAADGTLLARGETDSAGEFRYRPTRRQDHRVEVTTGDGHTASWTVRADELTTVPTEAADGPATPAMAAPAGPPAIASDPPAASMEAAGNASPAVGLMEIEAAVARQIRPLREELLGLREHTRLTDVLGGIGYIFGLAGFALWWRSRQKPRRP